MHGENPGGFPIAALMPKDRCNAEASPAPGCGIAMLPPDPRVTTDASASVGRNPVHWRISGLSAGRSHLLFKPARGVSNLGREYNSEMLYGSLPGPRSRIPARGAGIVLLPLVAAVRAPLEDCPRLRIARTISWNSRSKKGFPPPPSSQVR